MNEPVGWAVRFTDGSLFVDMRADCSDEAAIWRRALGLVTQEEVAWHIERGARAFRCRVVEVVDEKAA